MCFGVKSAYRLVFPLSFEVLPIQRKLLLMGCEQYMQLS